MFEVVSTFDRPNLFYGVKFINRTHTFREELAKEVMKDCQSGGSTIIYCTTIKDVEEVLIVSPFSPHDNFHLRPFSNS